MGLPTSAEPELLTLRDGRTLAHAAFGAGPGAPTLFYCHGFPASRLEAAMWHDAALAVGVRILAPDRPGMGRSSFQANRTLLDWPGDLVALADHLGLERFGLLGVSGGAPYVLAAVRSLPAARLRAAAVVSGLYPVALGTAGMLRAGRALLWAAPRLTGVVATLLDLGLGRAARDARHPEKFEQLILRDLRSRPAADRACLDEDERLRTRFLASVRESFQPGSRGVAWDARLLGAPWGFALTEVAHANLALWHGGLDVNSPVAMARKAATLLPGARLEVRDDEAHVSLIAHHMHAVLQQLLAAIA